MERAHAKVNLWLNVVGRRADGYHLLDTLVDFVDLADTLEVEVADKLTLVVDGPQAGTLAREPDNLVLKAARELAAYARIEPRVKLRLTKYIPVAAGLGGGSADAAAAIVALGALWPTEIPEEDFMALCSRIGADVPMCLARRTVIARGVGEQISGMPSLPPCGVLLVNPAVSLPTAEVFAARQGAFSTPRAVKEPPWPALADLVAELLARGNDLTAAAIGLRPVIGDVLAFLKQSERVRYAAMSGSGATCFALYDSTDDAQRAAQRLPGGWWRHAGRFPFLA